MANLEHHQVIAYIMSGIANNMANIGVWCPVFRGNKATEQDEGGCGQSGLETALT